MFEIVKYNPDLKEEWDSFIPLSKNGTFLFFRDYMDYHSDRYKDCSFLIYKKGRLIAVLPGNIEREVYFSHQGLTYGGLILFPASGIKDVLKIFESLNIVLKQIGIREVIYKPVPYPYHLMPSQEDIYVLFTLNAEKTACHLSSAISEENRTLFKESRKGGIRKGRSAGIKVGESSDYKGFWEVLRNNLLRTYKVSPVHTLEEIIYLKSMFPGNIILYTSLFNGEIVAGTVIYRMKNIAHVQYISANETGKKNGALDLLFYELINNVYPEVPFFDFGSSTEKMGTYLNEKLIFQKEGFGGKGFVYETYKYTIR